MYGASPHKAERAAGELRRVEERKGTERLAIACPLHCRAKIVAERVSAQTLLAGEHMLGNDLP